MTHSVSTSFSESGFAAGEPRASAPQKRAPAKAKRARDDGWRASRTMAS